MSTTRTVTIPCPKCGEDVTQDVTLRRDGNSSYAWEMRLGITKDGAHRCKPKSIDPNSLEDWTLCEIEHDSFGTVYYEVMRGLYRLGSKSSRKTLPSYWRIVRTFPKNDNMTTSEPDPPQPEWHEGDLVLDRDGLLWKRGHSYWHNAENVWSPRNDADLTDELSPLRRVHLADPAKGEVVVSIEGRDKDLLCEALGWAGRSIVRDAARAAQAAGLLDEEA